MGHLYLISLFYWILFPALLLQLQSSIVTSSIPWGQDWWLFVCHAMTAESYTNWWQWIELPVHAGVAQRWRRIDLQITTLPYLNTEFFQIQVLYVVFWFNKGLWIYLVIRLETGCDIKGFIRKGNGVLYSRRKQDLLKFETKSCCTILDISVD